jgi:hypothetical protein
MLTVSTMKRQSCASFYIRNNIFKGIKRGIKKAGNAIAIFAIMRYWLSVIE